MRCVEEDMGICTDNVGIRKKPISPKPIGSTPSGSCVDLVFRVFGRPV